MFNVRLPSRNEIPALCRDRELNSEGIKNDGKGRRLDAIACGMRKPLTSSTRTRIMAKISIREQREVRFEATGHIATSKPTLPRDVTRQSVASGIHRQALFYYCMPNIPSWSSAI